MIFDHSGAVVGVDQKEHEQIYPKPGWVEHDASEIWQRTTEGCKPALSRPPLMTSVVRCQISEASCSTQPGLG